MIVIKSEAFISDKGKNEINEDSLKCISGTLYVVCDGVGGNGNGLLASQILVESITNSLSHSKDLVLSDAIKEAEQALENYKSKNKNTRLMASTFALTHINDSSILIGWVGDSRVYQFRDGKIILKTTDHTWISEAIEQGVITEFEGLFHSERNRITRSVKGSSQPTTIEQRLITDILDDDYFMICSDGIVETFIDSDLEELFAAKKNVTLIINSINEQCAQFSTDNYSAFVYKVGIK